jgi:flagellar biosynthetic protein FlhB
MSILAQRAMVFAPSKLQFKLSRISVVANAKNKFGLNGWFEFGKSFAKLLLYSICLGLFLNARLPEIIGSVAGHGRGVAAMMGRTCIEFLILALLIATVIGAVDAVWQHFEFRRKHRMSRKEIMDEAKDAEGDPHLKQQRRARAQAVASSQMMAEVPTADVIIVNPTHFAVALRWSRAKGAAPVCVAKGVDEIAATIRRVGQESGVPIHSDPPTARAIHATVEIGEEISEELYAPVAVAIRFAEDMRRRAKGQVPS